MVKLSDLKIGEIFYMVDEFDGFPVITQIKVIEKGKGYRIVENIKHLEDNYELYNDFYFTEYDNYEECRFTKITKDNLHNIYIDKDDNELKEEIEFRISEIEQFSMFCDYRKPEDYPDWDGDESIMYYLENYSGEDEIEYEEE